MGGIHKEVDLVIVVLAMQTLPVVIPAEIDYSTKDAEIDNPCPPRVPPWLGDMNAQGGFSQYASVTPTHCLDMQGVTARRQIGETSLLVDRRHTPLMVIPRQVILILDVVLIRIVDALEMHDEGFLIMRETHLSFLQHLEEFCMPIFQLVSLIESLSFHLNTRDMKRSLVVQSPGKLGCQDHSHTPVLPLQSLEEVEIGHLSMIDESQSLVGTHPHLAFWSLDQGIDGVGRQRLRDSIVLELMLMPIVEVQASSIGCYPNMPCILKNHRIDKEIIIESRKFRRIEESTDTKASLVDTITSMGRSHRNNLLIRRLHDTLNFIDWQVVNGVIHISILFQ